jgi:alpha-tubulin suppressor-like RCC1 family protein
VRFCVLLILVAGCGARSGLLSPDPVAAEDAGQLPDAGTDAGMPDVPPPPPPPPQIEPAVQVSAGLFHSCAATRIGRVHCWGFNNLGQLGDGTIETRRFPVAHAGVNDALSITAGREHGCAIRGDRSVWCWGANIRRQLGDGSSEFRRLQPVQVVGLSSVSAIVAGGEHTCASVSDALHCWGLGFSGTPVRVALPERLLEVAGGYRHTCARLESGRVSCWGNSSREPMHPEAYVPGLPPVVSISAGGLHSCAIEASGAVWCWVYETFMVDEELFISRPTAAERVAIDDAVQLSAGHEFTCAVRAGGRVTCWGINERGQLGDGGVDQSGGFVDPVGVARATQVSAGWRHACALQDNGVVMCWGRNTEGQIGDGTISENRLPIMALVVVD